MRRAKGTEARREAAGETRGGFHFFCKRMFFFFHHLSHSAACTLAITKSAPGTTASSTPAPRTRSRSTS